MRQITHCVNCKPISLRHHFLCRSRSRSCALCRLRARSTRGRWSEVRSRDFRGHITCSVALRAHARVSRLATMKQHLVLPRDLHWRSFPGCITLSNKGMNLRILRTLYAPRHRLCTCLWYDSTSLGSKSRSNEYGRTRELENQCHTSGGGWSYQRKVTRQDGRVGQWSAGIETQVHHILLFFYLQEMRSMKGVLIYKLSKVFRNLFYFSSLTN